MGQRRKVTATPQDLRVKWTEPFPVTTTQVGHDKERHSTAYQAALDAADGDHRRLRTLPNGDIIVTNQATRADGRTDA